MGLRQSKTAISATVWALGLFALSGAFLGVTGVASHGLLAGSPARTISATHAGPVAAAHPSGAAHPGVTAVVIRFTNQTIPTYTLVPSTVSITVLAFNYTTSSSNTNVSFGLYAKIGTAAPFLTPLLATWAVPVTSSGQTNFTAVLNQTNVFAHESNWVSPYPSFPTDGRYFFAAWVYVHLPSQNLSAATATLGTTNLVANHAWATLVSPNPLGGPISPGNVTVAATYSGDFISAANVSIYTSTGTLAYSAILTTGATGNVTAAAAAPWLVVTPGTYNATVALTTDYGSPVTFTAQFTVAKAVGPSSTVYVNTTTYSNKSAGSQALISGWSPGPTAALLLVVGTIIGMIVALVLGRMMWGSAPAGPAQPWSGAAKANECSICHQSFASEDEMKEHQKTAHGM